MKFINKDKVLHFLILGFIPTIFVGFFYPLLGFAIGVLIAVGKEVYDYNNQGANTPDGMDFVATMVGVNSAMIILGQWG